MATCVFLGHDEVYDVDVKLWSRIRAAVDQITAAHDEVEFLFYQEGYFFNLCLTAALGAKNQSHTRVTITLVVHAKRLETYLQQSYSEIPLCMIDKIVPVSVPEPKNHRDFSQPYKKTMRFLLAQATHVISGVYGDLYESENQLLAFARRQRGLQVIDVTDEETAANILADRKTLPEREQMVLGMLPGRTYREISEQVGVSYSRLQQIVSKAGRRLRHSAVMRRRRLEKVASDQWSCGILQMGPVTYDALASFEHCLHFLLSKYRVSKFFITAEIAESGFMFTLKRKMDYFGDRFATVVLEDCGQKGDSYCPPCDNAMFLKTSDNTGIAHHIMALADFCICDLSSLKQAMGEGVPFAQTVLLDIGHHAAEVCSSEEYFAKRAGK